MRFFIIGVLTGGIIGFGVACIFSAGAVRELKTHLDFYRGLAERLANKKEDK